jgi:hypothetical protein
VFLDTCVVDFTLDHGAEIHDNVAPPADLDARTAEDFRKAGVEERRTSWHLRSGSAASTYFASV